MLKAKAIIALVVEALSSLESLVGIVLLTIVSSDLGLIYADTRQKKRIYQTFVKKGRQQCIRSAHPKTTKSSAPA